MVGAPGEWNRLNSGRLFKPNQNDKSHEVNLE